MAPPLSFDSGVLLSCFPHGVAYCPRPFAYVQVYVPSQAGTSYPSCPFHQQLMSMDLTPTLSPHSLLGAVFAVCDLKSARAMVGLAHGLRSLGPPHVQFFASFHEPNPGCMYGYLSALFSAATTLAPTDCLLAMCRPCPSPSHSKFRCRCQGLSMSAAAQTSQTVPILVEHTIGYHTYMTCTVITYSTVCCCIHSHVCNVCIIHYNVATCPHHSLHE
jgi:hypothetical protein